MMMHLEKHRDLKFRYFDDTWVKVIDLPYGNTQEYVATLILPKKNVETTIRQLLQDQWHTWSTQGKELMGRIWLPRIKAEWLGEDTMKTTLQDLGLQTAFTKKANFQGMGPAGFFLNQFIHKTMLEVDEEGTRAAAVTAAATSRGAGPPSFTFNANRPFLFVVREKVHNVVVFLAKITDSALSPPTDNEVRQMEWETLSQEFKDASYKNLHRARQYQHAKEDLEESTQKYAEEDMKFKKAKKALEDSRKALEDFFIDQKEWTSLFNVALRTKTDNTIERVKPEMALKKNVIIVAQEIKEIEGYYWIKVDAPRGSVFVEFEYDPIRVNIEGNTVTTIDEDQDFLEEEFFVIPFVKIDGKIYQNDTDSVQKKSMNLTIAVDSSGQKDLYGLDAHVIPQADIWVPLNDAEGFVFTPCMHPDPDKVAEFIPLAK